MMVQLKPKRSSELEEFSYCRLISRGALLKVHLFSRTTTSDVTVYLGRRYQQLPNANEESKTISQIINHPSYNSQTQDNDISLLKLSTAVTFTDYIRPICLASSGSTYVAGTNAWITGWGTINSDGDHNFFFSICTILLSMSS